MSTDALRTWASKCSQQSSDPSPRSCRAARVHLGSPCTLDVQIRFIWPFYLCRSVPLARRLCQICSAKRERASGGVA